MPWKKYSQRSSMKKRPFKRRRTGTKKAMMYSIAKRVVSRQQETKYYDIQQAGALGISNVGTGVNLSSFIAQGDTQITRDGTVLVNKGILFSFLISGHAQALIPSQRMRIMVVRAYAENLATVGTTDILQYTATSLTTVSPKQYNTRSKYKIMYDKTFSLASGWIGIPVANAVSPLIPGYPDVKVKRMFLKFNHKTTYDANGTQVRDGAIYLFFFSDYAAAATNPEIIYSARYFFTDS